MLSGRDESCSSEDMAPSSSASQSESTKEERGDGSGDGIEIWNLGVCELMSIVLFQNLILRPFNPRFATAVLVLGLRGVKGGGEKIEALR